MALSEKLESLQTKLRIAAGDQNDVGTRMAILEIKDQLKVENADGTSEAFRQAVWEKASKLQKGNSAGFGYFQTLDLREYS